MQISRRKRRKSIETSGVGEKGEFAACDHRKLRNEHCEQNAARGGQNPTETVAGDEENTRAGEKPVREELLKKLKFIMSAVMLTACMTAFIGAGGATAFAYEGEEPAIECEHEYTEETVSGTCYEKGYTKYTCNLCGDTYTDNYTEANGHRFDEIVIGPTCTHRGYTIHYCKECGYEYSDSYVPATGHAYEAEEHLVNCTENGYTVYTCKNCGDEYTVDGEEAIGHDYEEKTVGRTCESYGYTVHTCKNCADRYVTDYVKPAGHDYEKTVVKAEEGKVGYTKYTCKECDYNYVSDFVTSGDDGYIEENPDTPTDPEQPDKPTEPDKPENPDQPENPDKPENPDEHTHVYVFDAVVREQEKTMTVSYVCECGDNRTEFVKVEFTSADDGSGVVLIPGENGELDFAVLEGKYIVTVTNDNGEELMVYEVNLARNEPKPIEPEQPDKPSEPEQPKEPESPGETDKPSAPTESEGKDNTETPNDSVKEKKKVSASAILLPILLVLSIGGGVTFFIIKKKKTGKIKKTEKENEKENK